MCSAIACRRLMFSQRRTLVRHRPRADKRWRSEGRGYKASPTFRLSRSLVCVFV